MDDRQAIAISEFVSDRTPRPLTAPLMHFDLADEVAALRAEPVFAAHGHNARTLIKHSEFRLVLIVLAAGKRIHEQPHTERFALQPLRGELRVHVPTETLTLRTGQLLALDRGIEHSFEANEECELLLWVGWSRGR